MHICYPALVLYICQSCGGQHLEQTFNALSNLAIMNSFGCWGGGGKTFEISH